MNISTRTILGFSLLALAAGCNGSATSDELQTATDGAEATAASSQSISLASNVFASASSTDPATAAAQVAGRPSSPAGGVWPAGCETHEQDPTNPLLVHVTFNDCSGPFGIVHIDGGEDVVLSPGAGGALTAQITGVNLTANGKPIVFSATADITFPTATTRSVAWQGAWTRTTELGNAVVHHSNLTIQIDTTTECATTNGTAETSVSGRQVDTTINGYELCHDTTGQEGCPEGNVEHTREPSGKSISVAFDGSDVAEVTGPRGDTFPVDLVCTPLASGS